MITNIYNAAAGMDIFRYSSMRINSVGRMQSPYAGNRVNLPLNAYSPKVTYQDVSGYLTGLNRNVQALKSTAKTLSSTGLDGTFSKKAVTADNTGITGTAQSGAAVKAYTVRVDQLAAVQVNKGNALDTKAGTAFAQGNHTFALKVGSQEKNISFSVNAGETNQMSLGKMAAAINYAKAGVSASVITDDKTGKSALQLTADKTGTVNSFTITDKTGNAAAASGIQGAVIAAQDARYTVDGREMVSSSNTVSLDSNAVQLTLNKAESKDIRVAVGADTKGVREDVQKFADAYNKMLSFASSQSERFAGADQVKKELTGLVSARRQSLETIGIQVKTDGTLAVDAKKLEDSFSQNPARVKSIFSGYSGVGAKVLDKSNDILASQLRYVKPNLMQNEYNRFIYTTGTFSSRLMYADNLLSGMVVDAWL